MLLEGGIYGYVIPIGRTIAGFFVGLILGIVGGWMGLTFNAEVNYAWPSIVHISIYISGIGLGAGLGAYLGWINLNLNRYLIIASVLLALLGGVIGSFLGYGYGLDFIDPTYMGARDTRINITHFSAAIGAIIVSASFGLFYHFRTHG